MDVRAAIYCRISSDRDDTKLGVERQEQDCRKLCADRGWTVAGTYVDNDISAADPKKVRPEYRRLLRDIEAGKIDAVVVWAEDRLHRQPIELEEFVRTCDGAGMTQLVTVSGTIDLGTGDGMMVARIKGAVAAEEVRKTKQRVMRRKRQKAEAGEYAGGRRAYGFEKDGITHIPEEAARIREAATRVLEGESLNSIKVDWNAQGVATVSGKTWSHTMLKRLVTSLRTVGRCQHQGEDFAPAAWEPILDRATWEQCCSILGDPSRRRPPASRKYPLTGVLRCGLCKEPLKAMPRGGKRVYGCKAATGGCGKIYARAEAVEQFVFAQVVRWADSPDLRDAIRSEKSEDTETATQLLVANAKDQRQLDQLSTDYTDQIMDRATYIKQSGRLRERMDERSGRIVALRSHSALDRMGGSVADTWDEMNSEDRRMVCLAVLNAIYVHPVEVQGRNQFDPDRLFMDWRYDMWAGVVDGKPFNRVNTDEPIEQTLQEETPWMRRMGEDFRRHALSNWEAQQPQ